MSKQSRENSSKPAGAGKTGRGSRASATTKAGKIRKTAGKGAAATSSRKSSSRRSEANDSPKNRRTTATASHAIAPAVLSEGAMAPAFTLPRDGGSSVSLNDFLGKKLVLFFYPRADTPGCTREAIDFTRLADAFAASGTAILGISGDSLKAQEAFRDKHGLSVPLISDERHQMLEAYGAWGEKSMYGKRFLGIIRTTVLLDARGRIARIWRNVRVDGHAAEVLDAARAL